MVNIQAPLYDIITHLETSFQAENAGDDETSDATMLWGEQVYLFAVIITSSCLIVIYAFSMYKACKGTSFVFIITLQVLFILSNIGAITSCILEQKANRLGQQLQSDDTLNG